MRRRRNTLALLTAVLLVVATAAPTNAQTRRAMLVGINTYAPPEDQQAAVSRKWRDLDGAANDVVTMEAILRDKFRFTEIHALTNREATRDAILQNIDAWLVEPSQPGDIVVFYYAGHGSQVRNTATSEADGLDETIVPADSWTGAQDIRDKELRDAFNKLLARGVSVTMIFDSCHSGSITRGLASGKSRYIEPSPLVVEDSSNPPAPVERGALVISAAQDDEVARELADEEGNPRGAFTWSLSRAIATAAPGESAEQLFLRARAILRSTGATQEPVIAGNAERRRQSFLETDDNEGALPSVVVIDVEESGTVVLQGGIATGLRPGAELVRYDADSTVIARLEVFESAGLARSLAEIVEGDELPEPGDTFAPVRWVSSAAEPLRLFFPEFAGSYDELGTAITAVAGLSGLANIDVVDDPTEVGPDFLVFWMNGGWQILSSSGDAQPLPAENMQDAIAAAISDSWSSAEPARLFVSLPPFEKLASRMRARFERLDVSVEFTDHPAHANYVFAGRPGVSSVEYAWVLREAMSDAAIETQSPAPERSDWLGATESKLFAASILSRDVNKLNVIWGWLNLLSPPDDGTFPYSFDGFENVVDGSRKYAGDTLTVGEQYRVVLSASFAEIEKARVKAMSKNAERRFLYLFVMDRSGNGYLLYPAAEYGNVENDVVMFSELEKEIRLPSKDGVLFEVAEPVGIDSFFLISSAQPIPQPGVFNFEGIRTRGPAAGEHTDLSRLFHALGAGTRGAKQPVPTSWSLERISVRSVPSSQ